MPIPEFGEPEIEKLDSTCRIYDDVARFQIAVNYTGFMSSQPGRLPSAPRNPGCGLAPEHRAVI